MTRLEPDLAALADLGPYFAVEASAPPVGWFSLERLSADDSLARQRVAAVRTTLEAMSAAPVPARVAASIAFLGLAGRIVSPPIGLLATQRLALSLTASEALWRPAVAGPIPFAYQSFGITAAVDAGDAAKALLRGVVRPLLAGLVDVFAEPFRLSRAVLWGNVASAIAGAALMIDGADRHALSAQAIAEHAIAGDADLARTGRFRLAQADRRSRRVFRRDTCCLFYRVAGGGFCTDCVLARVPIRRAAAD